MHLSSRFTVAALLAGTAFVLPSLRADSLIWGNTTYTYNASQAGTNPTPGAVGTVNGNALSISYGTASYFTTSTTAPSSPAVGTYVTGGTTTYTDGGTGGSKALQIFANFDNGANIIAGAGIPVTIFFSKPVSNLIFSFYDVDSTTGASPFNDYITSISGKNGTNGATVVPVGMTAGVANTTSIGTSGGTATGTGSSAQNVGDGNVTVTFGATPITQFSFIYTDTAATPGGAAHSTTQIIALGNLTFTTVPEPSTWALLGMSGALALGLTVRRRAAR